MSRRCPYVLASAAALLVSWTHPGRADPFAAGATRVIELFTSQGCPRCPPADALVGELAHEPRTIALSFAVNYWDYAGWQDTLAAPEFVARQRAYAAVRGDKRIFTPQVIVDGRAVEPGADKAAILRDMASLQASDGTLDVPLELREHDGRLHIEIGAAPKGREGATGTVLVLRVARTKTVQIERGANSGRSITYTNAVRALRGIGTWTGGPETFDLLELKGDDEAYVVLVQAGTPDRPGAILAAAQSAAP